MPLIAQQLSADGVTTEGRNIVTEAILEIITNEHIASMVLSVGGTGYAVGDTFRLNAGTPVQVNGDDFHATGRVTAVGGSPASSPAGIGEVTAVEIISWGAYTALPVGSPILSPDSLVNGVATITLTGAGDDALTVDIVTDTAKWTLDSSVIDSPFTQNEWLCTSVKTSNAPLIGARSQLSVANDGVRLQIGSSYSGILPWDGQPGTPPTNTFYIAVPNQDPFIYVSTTERRVNVMVTNGTSFQYAGDGLFIPFTDVAGNYPFPGIIHGQATTVRAFTEVFQTLNRGVCNPIDFSGLGCYQYRNNLSSEWLGITSENNQGVDACQSQMWPDQSDSAQWSFTHAPVPTGSLASAANMNPFNSTFKTMAFEENKWFAADQAAAIGPAGPAPLGIGSQLHFTVQSHIISNQAGDVQMIGIIDGFENVHGRGLVALDEIQNQDGRRYIVFPDTASTDLTNWIAMEMI